MNSKWSASITFILKFVRFLWCRYALWFVLCLPAAISQCRCHRTWPGLALSVVGISVVAVVLAMHFHHLIAKMHHTMAAGIALACSAFGME